VGDVLIVDKNSVKPLVPLARYPVSCAVYDCVAPVKWLDVYLLDGKPGYHMLYCETHKPHWTGEIVG
jgi:hypothetical protein